MGKSSRSMGRWDYTDFELEIREGGPREYPVTVRSPPGETREEMRFPFDEGEIESRLQNLKNALRHPIGERRRVRSQEEQAVQDFGQALFEGLFVGEVRTRYQVSLREASRQNKDLRLKLHIRPAELVDLPWEFLYDPDRAEYLCLSSKMPLVRYVDLHRSIEQLPETPPLRPPLRILGMVINPADLAQLALEREKQLVEEAVKGLQSRGLVNIEWIEGQSWRTLQRAMRRGPWHIFHFIGHGGFDPVSEEGAIAFPDDEGGSQRLLPARNLAGMLNHPHPLRLVFLKSCAPSQGDEGHSFSSTAVSLVRWGIPAVVTIQYEISDKATIEFSRNFYEAITDGLPIDAAVTYARMAISLNSALEWGIPVLNMPSPDGRILDVSPREAGAQGEKPQVDATKPNRSWWRRLFD